MLMLHSPGPRDKFMKMLTNKGAPAPMKIASIVSMVITTILMKVMQTKKPHLNLILGAIKTLVKEVAQMAAMAWVKSTPEERKQAAGLAGKMIEDTLG